MQFTIAKASHSKGRPGHKRLQIVWTVEQIQDEQHLLLQEAQPPMLEDRYDAIYVGSGLEGTD